MGTADHAGQAAGDVAGDAIDTLKSAPEAARRQTQGNPLAAGAVAFGFGVLLASVFPASETEKRAAEELMDKAEPLKEGVIESGKEVAEHMKQPARDAMDHLKETAAEAKESVQEVAQGVVDETLQTTRARPRKPSAPRRPVRRPRPRKELPARRYHRPKSRRQLPGSDCRHGSPHA